MLIGLIISILIGVITATLLYWRVRAMREMHKLNKMQMAAIKKQNEQLTHANNDLKQFAYVVGHDLKEPLRMIKSFSKVLAQHYSDKLDDDGIAAINFLDEGAERIESMLGDLLHYARVGIREDSEHIEWISLNDVLDTVKHNLAQRINENNARINYSGLPMMYTSRSQMVQLFQNLIANAIKFRSEDEPLIEIEAKILEQGYEFSVSDNGIGIPEEHAERIFKIFQRLHSRDKYEGTGIGLAICQKIVQRHNGSIWVESEVGQGTTFYFTLLHQ